MLRIIKVPALALVFSLCAPSLHANSTESNLNRLMELSGVSESIVAMPKSIASEMSKEELSAEIGDPNVAGVISNALQNSLTAPLFQSEIMHALHERLSERDVKLLLDWYDTPLGERVSIAHRADQFELDQRVSAGERPPMTAERTALIQKLDQVVMGSDNALQLAVETATIMGHSMMSSMGMPIDIEQMRTMVEMEMMLERDKMVEEYHAMLGFTYESLSDDDLEQMIAYMFQPEATVFCDALWQGMRSAFHKGGAALGVALVAELQGAF